MVKKAEQLGDGDTGAQESTQEQPAAGVLVEHDGRYGIALDGGRVLWLGVPERCELPVRRVG